MKNKTFLKNAAIISLGGVVAKGLGALYRIPLTNILGGYGMGLYQMAYPLFCVLLTFSSAGIPSALARMIAREETSGRGGEALMKTALKLFAVLGLCGSLLMILFAPYMSALQQEANLVTCYFMLAPSVFLVALIAVFRGYFQGKNNMKPTAVSEVVETVIKCTFGLVFAHLYAKNVSKAVHFTLFSVTISELFALIYLYLSQKKERVLKTLPRQNSSASFILFAALPVMAATSLLPLSQAADSVMIVRLLSGYSTRAVSYYGLFTGGAIALISLPATACSGIAAAAVPSVTTAFSSGNAKEGVRRALYALAVTFALSVPCALALFFGADKIVSLLYSSLSPEDAKMLSALIKLMSVSAVSLAGVDTLAACLTGMGRAKFAALSMFLAIVVKFALQYVLVKNSALSILGAGIAANACYLVAFFLDLFYTVKKQREEKHGNGYRFGRRERRPVGAGNRSIEKRGERGVKERIARNTNIEG